MAFEYHQRPAVGQIPEDRVQVENVAIGAIKKVLAAGSNPTSNIEYVDHRTIGNFAAGTLCNCLCQKRFQFPEISNLCANSLKMSRHDRSYFGAFPGHPDLITPTCAPSAFFIAASLVCVGAGCWLVYRSSKLACGDGAACARLLPNKFVKVALIAATPTALMAVLPEI
jgi:hypothetical protein